MNAPLSPDDVMACVKRLPALPQIVRALDQALQNDTTSTTRVVEVIASDPAMTVEALRLANSSFYGASGCVVTLRDAVQILGVQTLSGAVTTAAVRSCFDPAACPGFDFEGSWRHALATALCSQTLGATRGVDACAAYTSGLLHDIGTLALATYFPKAFAATLAFSIEHVVPPLEAERELLGLDHAVVGGMIARHWQLAPEIIEAIELHHEVPDTNRGALLDVLHLADNIIHALDLANAPDDMVPPLSLSAWGRIGVTGDELKHVFERIETRLKHLDLGLALPPARDHRP